MIACRWLVPILVAQFAGSATAQAKPEGVPIKGVVIGSDGQPSTGARLGTGWWFDHSRLSAYGGQSVWPATTTRKANGWSFVPVGVDGEFDARVLPRRGVVQLTVFSKDLSEAGTFSWKPTQNLQKLKLRLAPVARFRADVVCSDLGRKQVPATAYLNASDGRRLGRFKVDDGKVDLRLPAGHYKLYMYGAFGQDLARRSFPVAVFGGEDIKSKDIDIPARFIALHKGRRLPPWSVKEARGVGLANATIEHYRGKWLLVEVWSFRSGSASRTIPELIEFDRKWRQANPNRQKPYEIVLLHSGVKSLKEFDAKVKELGLRKKHWGDEALPFPLLIDPDGATKRSWKLRWSSQALLFDPKGCLWGESDDAEHLGLAVAGKLQPVKPRQLPRRPK